MGWTALVAANRACCNTLSFCDKCACCRTRLSIAADYALESADIIAKARGVK